ncbi:FAD-dependent oxidoreductase [Allokutzneria multivorans]|uniref:FAD-dependent oxidoreductase n=1 Tax=Allokutzneria multivorans TaxID=1142134 RepID=A0ABP7TV58_9PSEU
MDATPNTASPEHTDVAVVGAGPAGMLLAYLLARAGSRVTLLETHGDFERRYRGDTLSPATLDLLDRLGLADRLLATVAHTRSTSFRWHTVERTYTLTDYTTASRRHPFYALIPQPAFLGFLAEEAGQYPGFDLRMKARASTLIHDCDGRITGLTYTSGATTHTLTADLVVAADGRASKIRALSGLPSTELGVGNDLLWFDLPRDGDTDPALSGLDIFCSPGRVLAALNQGHRWQLAFTIPTGSYARAREEGVEPVRTELRRHLPWLGDRIDELTSFSQLSLLTVRITRLPRWTRPGLLLIGDAAHVISPVGGSGINHALADAVAAANHLVPALRQREPTAVDTAAKRVQQHRKPVVDAAQRQQSRIEIATQRAMRRGEPRPALPLRLLSRIGAFARWSGRRTNTNVKTPAPAQHVLSPVTAPEL